MTATGNVTSSDDSGVLDEAYERLHRTGPEYAGRLRRAVGLSTAPEDWSVSAVEK